LGANFDKTYGQEDYFGSRENHLLERYNECLIPGSRVLDVGIGQGRNAYPLAVRKCVVEGIDTSEEAIRQVRAHAQAEELSLTAKQVDFQDYEPSEPFDAVLCFGLLQMLSPPVAASLIQRLRLWTRRGGTLFLIAWHVDDPGFDTYCRKWERTGLRSFRSSDGENFRTFLGRGEILQMFRGWNVLHHSEGLGPVHQHGDSPPERHGEVEVVLQKP